MFRAAANIALVVALPLAIIESVISPYITRLYHAGDLGKLQKLTQVASLAALLTSAVPAIVLLLFSTEAIIILYGSDYAPAFSTLVVIVLGYVIVNLVGLSMQLLYATEYQASAFRISTYGALVTVLLCSFLIPFFGALGAGIALGLGKALRAALFVVEARRRLEIKTSLIW
jgi:O-antigen/teichoic acid export membrane protein